MLSQADSCSYSFQLALNMLSQFVLQFLFQGCLTGSFVTSQFDYTCSHRLYMYRCSVMGSVKGCSHELHELPSACVFFS